MYLTHLSLRNFRNYQQLDLDLPQGLVVFYGDNAQGKSNLLEAIYLLAITRSHRAENEREMLPLGSLHRGGYTRVAGAFHRGDAVEVKVQVDIMWIAASGAAGEQGPGGILQKRLRVNGIPKRASDALGRVNAVLFCAQDLDLALGPPSLRRRFLDLLLAQVDRAYLRTLQGYHKVLAQRNALLKRIGEGAARPEELAFWDQELSTLGASLVWRRRQALADLTPLASAIHQELTHGRERLELSYLSSVGHGASPEAVAGEFHDLLPSLRRREVALGQSTVGPHRDDMKLLVNGVAVGPYASRGQARTVALTLRLTEARFLAQERGEAPILLLDDVLSELDGERRRQLLAAAARAQQALITTLESPSPQEPLLHRASRFLVRSGTVARQPSAGAPDPPGDVI